MPEGDCGVGVFIDDEASDEQAEKLLGVFSGQLGGPMEALGPPVGENLGVERAPIEVREEGLRRSVRIGDALDSRSRTWSRSAWRPESRPDRRRLPSAGSEFTIAEASRSKINAFGIEYEGKSALSSSHFSLAA